jgi:hypothetical protein
LVFEDDDADSVTVGERSDLGAEVGALALGLVVGMDERGFEPVDQLVGCGLGCSTSAIGM